RHMAHALEWSAHPRCRKRRHSRTQSVLTEWRDERRGRRALRAVRAGSVAFRELPARTLLAITNRMRIVNDTLIFLSPLVVSAATLLDLASLLTLRRGPTG